MNMKMKKKKQSKTTESVDESRPPDFSTAITRIAVAQICQSVGFRGAQRLALETLTDIAARYLRSLAKSAAASAVSTGRTQSNLLDVVCSLEELHSPIGFKGNSNVGQSLLGSSTISDIMKFVNYTREIPFAKPVPRREITPVAPVPPPRLGSLGVGNQNHIPKWLPAIPEMGRKEEGRNREKKWGVILEPGTSEKIVGKELELSKEYARGEKTVEKEEKKRMELGKNGERKEGKKRGLESPLPLPREREKVRFKLGKEKMELVKNGVCNCRGGKRIMCQTANCEKQKMRDF